MEDRLRTLSESECYERCYGWRWDDDSVKVLPGAVGGSYDPREEPTAMGERLRSLLELRLDDRQQDAA
jgi:hypothetical protein